MKLNIAIVALALSSSVLTLAAPMPQAGSSWNILKKAVGKISGKSKSAAQQTSIYSDDYVPQYEEFSDATHPYIPKEHRASGGESSSKSGNEHSPEASPVHRSHGGGDSSKPAERDPRHGGDESGHSTSAPDEHFVGITKLGPPDHYYQPQYAPHIPQHTPYGYNHQSQYAPNYASNAPYDHYQPQYAPHIPQHTPYGYNHQSQYAPNYASNAPYDHYQPQYAPPIPQYDPHTPQNTHAWPYGPPGEVVPQHSSHDAHGFPIGEYHSGSPPKEGRVGFFF
ncbi:uncharacterized protein UBRO_20344 [Ustilago bromivora]|uniref:Uncharacterized protein n=1 Tax=Ustilago bromivora TaxID=307758 RepID=A0A1K0GE44_9BASI|nr:uncharacterized protein UBRO_20344 [Ustilago bromivora]